MLNNNIFTFSILDKNPDKYTDYPLNLLTELNTLLSIEILFFMILINSLLSIYLISKNIDVDKYIKNERLNKIVKYLLARYIKIWSVSSRILIIWSVICIIICIGLSKLILLLILR